VQPIPVTFAIMVRALAHAGMVDRLLEMIGRMQNEVCRLMLQHHDEGKLDTKYVSLLCSCERALQDGGDQHSHITC
jgi:pentatricopeptide repeat protein